MVKDKVKINIKLTHYYIINKIKGVARLYKENKKENKTKTTIIWSLHLPPSPFLWKGEGGRGVGIMVNKKEEYKYTWPV